MLVCLYQIKGSTMKIVVFLVFLLCSSAKALKCYTCTVSQTDIDQTCATDPASVTSGSAITNCDKAYCTIVRIEYVDPKNVIQSMVRDCVDKPIYINQVIEDSTYRTYYRACKQDLCNSGTGKASVSSATGNNGGATNLLVPGTGAASHISPQTTAILFVTVLLAMLTK